MRATYQITSLVTLETSAVSLDKLSRSLLLNSIVSYDGQSLGLVTHWDLVFLSRTWAGWALDAAQKKPPEEALVALSLVDQWLQDPGSVSREELNAAAGSAALAAAWAASRAARAAAGAASRAAAAAAGAAAAAAAAAWAADAAAAAGAADAAAAAGAAGAAAYQRQGRFIIEHLKKLHSPPSLSRAPE